jgi:hypothetical protein
MAAKRSTQPAPAKKKALPAAAPGKPSTPSKGAPTPPWLASAAKKTAAQRTDPQERGQEVTAADPCPTGDGGNSQITTRTSS